MPQRRPRTDLTEQRFGHWRVLERAAYKHNTAVWRCRCDCGTERDVRQVSLTCGKSTNCGCVRKERVAKINYKHGQSGSPEFVTWWAMRRRCANPAEEHYYGRGIRVCARWGVFENFLADMGPKPTPAHTLDRIDSDGDYMPENCRWATRTTQARNKRTNHFITAYGETLTLSAWSARFGIGFVTILKRIALGWSNERAVKVPVQRRTKRQ